MKKDELKSAIAGNSSIESTKQTEDLQWTKYKASQGHGFSAEDANAVNDKLHFKKVEKVGLDNSKNGPDRIVNGQAIQTKYCQNANDSVNAAFDNQTGLYRYKNMQLEVPKDQYEQAVEVMRKKIQEGKVPGVTDPSEAEKIVKKGSVTYQQAKNIAKAGNIDSLIFDVKTQSIAGLYGFGISFMVQYASCLWSGMKPKEAVELSVITGLKTGTIVLGTGVVTQQLLRTQMGRSFAAFSSSISKRVVDSLYSTEVGKKIIHKIASSVFGKTLTGAAAKNAVIKFLRTNVVTGTITTVVLSIPDFYRAAISRRISFKQFTKNITVTTAGVAGGAGGTIGGSVLGGVIGGAIGNVPGAIIGAKVGAVVGGVVGGLGASIGTKKIADCIVKDDAVEMFELVKDSIAQLGEDYFISEKEFEEAKIENFVSEKVNNKWLMGMFSSGNNSEQRKNYAYREFEPVFEEIASKRTAIKLPSEKHVKRQIARIRFTLFINWLKLKLLFWTKESKDLLNELNKEEMLIPLS